MNNPNTYQSGCTCAQCGAFVPYGAFHACTPKTTGTVNPQPLPTTWTWTPFPYLPVLERIAAALEKIAEALEPVEKYCDKKNRNLP